MGYAEEEIIVTEGADSIATVGLEVFEPNSSQVSNGFVFSGAASPFFTLTLDTLNSAVGMCVYIFFGVLCSHLFLDTEDYQSIIQHFFLFYSQPERRFIIIPSVVVVPILDDIYPEPQEQFLISLFPGPGFNSHIVVLSPNTSRVIIEDNDDGPRLQFIQPRILSVYESVEVFPVCVQLLDVPLITVTAKLEIANDMITSATGLLLD